MEVHIIKLRIRLFSEGKFYIYSRTPSTLSTYLKESLPANVKPKIG